MIFLLIKEKIEVENQSIIKYKNIIRVSIVWRLTETIKKTVYVSWIGSSGLDIPES